MQLMEVNVQVRAFVEPDGTVTRPYIREAINDAIDKVASKMNDGFVFNDWTISWTISVT